MEDFDHNFEELQISTSSTAEMPSGEDWETESEEEADSSVIHDDTEYHGPPTMKSMRELSRSIPCPESQSDFEGDFIDSEPDFAIPLPGYVSHDDPTYHIGPSSKTGPLYQLPPELQTNIASYCDQHSLAILARTCISMHKIAIEVLYRSITVKSEDSMALLHRCTGGTWRNQCLRNTQSLEAFLEWHPPSEARFQLAWHPSSYNGLGDIAVIDSMTSLRHLEIIWRYNTHVYRDRYKHMYVPAKLAPTLTSCKHPHHIPRKDTDMYRYPWFRALYRVAAVRHHTVAAA